MANDPGQAMKSKAGLTTEATNAQAIAVLSAGDAVSALRNFIIHGDQREKDRFATMYRENAAGPNAAIFYGAMKAEFEKQILNDQTQISVGPLDQSAYKKVRLTEADRSPYTITLGEVVRSYVKGFGGTFDAQEFIGFVDGLHNPDEAGRDRNLARSVAYARNVIEPLVALSTHPPAEAQTVQAGGDNMAMAQAQREEGVERTPVTIQLGEMFRRMESSQEGRNLFDPNAKFVTAGAPLGIADKNVLSNTPALWEFTGKEMMKQLRIMGITDPHDLAVELANNIFSSEESYRAYLTADNKTAYLQSLLMTSLGGTAFSQAAATDTTARNVQTNITYPQAVIVPRDVSLAVTHFNTAFNRITLSLDDIYNSIMSLPDRQLPALDKREFREMFMTIYALDQTLGQAFMLTIASALTSTTRNLQGGAFNLLMRQQLDVMDNLWHGRMKNSFEPLWLAPSAKLTPLERYMDVVYANLCFGSILLNGSIPRNIKATFASSFMIGFLGGVNGILNNSVAKNLDELATKLSPVNSSNWLLPINAILAMSAGIASAALKDVVIGPFTMFQQALRKNIGTKAEDAFVEAVKKTGEMQTLYSPMVLTPTLGILTAFANARSGTLGVMEPSYQTTAQSTTEAPPAIIQRATEVVSPNAVNIFKSALEISYGKGYGSPQEMFGGLIGSHLVVSGMTYKPLQEDQRGSSYPVPGDFIKMVSQVPEKDLPQFFNYAAKLTRSIPLKDVLEIYKKAEEERGDVQKYNQKHPDKLKAVPPTGLDALKARLEYIESHRTTLRKVPTKGERMA